ncbi:5-formyltetrahydrofolate cyclo-ligase [Streptomyces cocklensis]|jgi:5-formyltetrahydrofolate cyclo-ligase|uniref:5-formyltetrahydrofolate cyclo-ligase n=1 Tax=Actinacidiphila cocklensis TaxID=887465 RepID=UPI00203E704B|nr:5-formyltetrahydrofolate cyclo-ligase [Actinacidiphila cocklensis]MDD1057400.1 5-formyltetrahydrofolate cyclo-ligase [Actinacidiphila cocklensis]WSX79069.1 5-formyltetrahydrofolate cyclo-ligase [Streptomyces sp. NBC_00899]
MSRIRAQKTELRAQILRARGKLTVDQREVAARALTERVRGLPEWSDMGTVAAYVSMGTEPGTGPLIEGLRKAGTRVLLPVLLSDNDLDWAEYNGPDALARARRGLFEPTGPRLGPDAVTQAQLILLPGLAVDSNGVRLGRGGGSYDRALARVRRAATHPALVVLLYADEVVASVPNEPHDHLVDAALTPEGVHRFRG